MFSSPKISLTIQGMKYICLRLFTVFYLIQPCSKQIICFDFGKQNSVLPIVLYVPGFKYDVIIWMVLPWSSWLDAWSSGRGPTGSWPCSCRSCTCIPCSLSPCKQNQYEIEITFSVRPSAINVLNQWFSTGMT